MNFVHEDKELLLKKYQDRLILERQSISIMNIA